MSTKRREKAVGRLSSPDAQTLDTAADEACPRSPAILRPRSMQFRLCASASSLLIFVKRLGRRIFSGRTGRYSNTSHHGLPLPDLHWIASEDDREFSIESNNQTSQCRRRSTTASQQPETKTGQGKRPNGAGDFNRLNPKRGWAAALKLFEVNLGCDSLLEGYCQRRATSRALWCPSTDRKTNRPLTARIRKSLPP